MVKAQGSTEYLIIFAAGLTVAILIVYLASSSIETGTGVDMDRSIAYWSSKKPIAILDASSSVSIVVKVSGSVSYTYTEKVDLLLKNNGLEKIILLNMSVKDRGDFDFGGEILYPGETKLISYSQNIVSSGYKLRDCTPDSPSPGDVENFVIVFEDVKINYRKASSGSSVFNEVGDKLVLPCSFSYVVS